MSVNFVMSRQCESLGGFVFTSQQFSDELNPFESDVISKFDNIINILRELEDHFTQVRQEVIRKSSLEGKESDKIFAIKGRVISNKKKYYRSLEGDIMSLDKIFQEQLTKISRDLISLKVISGIEEKIETERAGKETITTYTLRPSTGNYEENLQEVVSSGPFVRSVAVPSIKKQENCTKPISIGRPVAKPLFKASSTTEVELPKRKIEYEKNEEMRNPPQRRFTYIPQEPINIPEDIGEEETNIKLEFGDRGKIIETSKMKKPVRSEKGHGFRLSQACSEVTPRKDLLMELPIFDDQ